MRNGVELDLTTREFELLEYLVQHRNAVVTREMMARDVWKEPDGMMTNVIDVYVSHLRKKIDLPGLRPLLRTIRGVGYSLRDT
jgi:DNA-binding response OmpR family regulator